MNKLTFRLKLNQETKEFVTELSERDDVLGIVLFGSWARGNQRSDSDVDLLVLTKDSFMRDVEYRNSQAFEIIYTPIEAAKSYYKNRLDEVARFWKIAKILYDKNGETKKLKEFAMGLVGGKKKPLNESTLKHFRFDAHDQFNFVRNAYNKGDVATANIIMTNKVYASAEIYFDTIAEWRPAPKQLLDVIKTKNIRLYSLLTDYYSVDGDFLQKVTIAEDIVELVFGAV